MRSTLVLPAYNEEMAIPKVFEECIGKVDEVIVVDDGSTDRTFEVAKEYGVKIFTHEKNMGKPEAVRDGVKKASGEIIILLDADYTYPARYIPSIIKEVENGADLVLGSRFLGEKIEMPFFRICGNIIASFFVTTIMSRRITDPQTGCRGFRRNNFEKLDVEARGLEYEIKMTKKALKLGLKVVEVPIGYRKRIGKSKLGIKEIWRMLWALFERV